MSDTPEVTSAVTALPHGQHDVGPGVVLGSNMFNLAALIGLGTTAGQLLSSRSSAWARVGSLAP